MSLLPNGLEPHNPEFPVTATLALDVEATAMPVAQAEGIVDTSELYARLRAVMAVRVDHSPGRVPVNVFDDKSSTASWVCTGNTQHASKQGVVG
jgi:hypothetical protein